MLTTGEWCNLISNMLDQVKKELSEEGIGHDRFDTILVTFRHEIGRGFGTILVAFRSAFRGISSDKLSRFHRRQAQSHAAIFVKMPHGLTFVTLYVTNSNPC